MKKSIYRFEEYLKKTRLSQKIFIYLMPVLVVGAGLYMFVLPSQDEELQTLQAQKEQLQRDIKRSRPRSYKQRIAKTKKELFALKEKVEEKKSSLQYLFAKISNLEIANFDNKKWTKTLNDILEKSYAFDIKIDHIKNSDPEDSKEDPNDDIVAKKYIEIVGKGSYNNTLKYLNFIENRDFIVDVKDIQMQKTTSADGEIEFTINFTIYGVNI